MVEGLQVTVPDKKKVAMLFQPTVLRCHFSTSSHQPAVVQWKFKSYCQDRMGESLGMSSTRAQSLSKRNLEWDPYLDCLDSRRTVRVVASKQGSTVTLGDFYRGREITIVHGNNAPILNLGMGGRLVSFFPSLMSVRWYPSLSPFQTLETFILLEMGASRDLSLLQRDGEGEKGESCKISRRHTDELWKESFQSPASSLRSLFLELNWNGFRGKTSSVKHPIPWHQPLGSFPKCGKQTLRREKGCMHTNNRAR